MQPSHVSATEENKEISPRFIMLIVGIVLLVLGGVGGLLTQISGISPSASFFVWLMVAAGVLMTRFSCWVPGQGCRREVHWPSMYKQPQQVMAQMVVHNPNGQAWAMPPPPPPGPGSQVIYGQSIQTVGFQQSMAKPYPVAAQPQNMGFSTAGSQPTAPSADFGSLNGAGGQYGQQYWNLTSAPAQFGASGTQYGGFAAHPGNVPEGSQNSANQNRPEDAPPAYWDAVKS